tara:strand:- start:314 stop:1423 length:1110 start_codon:yes stop_codon:yes gene_type:complete
MKNSLILLFCFGLLEGSDLEKRLSLAGNNRSEIEQAITEIPDEQYRGMEWLITHMPDEDIKTLSAEFLINNCSLAYEAWKNSPWVSEIPEDIFFDSILPYANLNERRDDWRKDFHNKFASIVNSTKTPYEAAVLLNHKIYEMMGVKYSTERPKADQSPYESIDAGMASCTGLSILLIDACRSVGIPARFVGTPLWYNNSGNHSWVEIWDDGWHFTGAAEPTGNKLNEAWFSELASKATKGDMKHGIFAATWNNSDIYFPMDWSPGVKTYKAVNVTDRYTSNTHTGELVPIRIRALDSSGIRQSVKVTIIGQDNFTFEGMSKGESCDANDHLTIMLPRGGIFTVQSVYDVQKIAVIGEDIIDLRAREIVN